MTGPQTVNFRFKEYYRSPIGLYPTGYTLTIGDRVYKNLDVVDVRPAADLEELPWFKATPTDAKPISMIGQLPPGTVDEVAPGVWSMRNVGGYNTMFARVNDCIAVLDAPASFGHAGSPIPPNTTPPDLSATIMEKVQAVTGKKVCYVIPTHHHNDHFGAIRGFAAAGATIVTTPANEALARRTAGVDARIEIVRDKKTFGSGDSRLDVWVIRNDPHAEEMLFVHFPQHRIAFEGDLSDYVMSARHFLRFIDRNALSIDRVFASHSSRPLTLIEIQWEDPGN